MKLRVCHVITSLQTGGAQTMLLRLLSAVSQNGIESSVVALKKDGLAGDAIRRLGIPVEVLQVRHSAPQLRGIHRMMRRWQSDPPDVVQTWLYHADLIGGVAARWCGLPVAWNIRHSTFDPRTTSMSTRCTVRVCAGLSRWVPHRILINSQRGKTIHEEMGYPAAKMQWLPNGFDLETFVPKPDARADVRRELGIDDDALVIGHVARLHPQKDHRTFLRAAMQVAARRGDVQFVLCGQGVDSHNSEIAAELGSSGLRDRFHFLGHRTDLPRLQAAFDIAASSSSHGEGLPNAVGEAMACAVPCVVTDVGDAALLVGDCGFVVPRGDPDALAAAMLRMGNLSHEARAELGSLARTRIAQDFDIRKIAQKYVGIWHAMRATPIGAKRAAAQQRQSPIKVGSSIPA